MAKAVPFTWIFNNTGGSLVTVSLLHASVNTSAVFLPIIPTDGSVRRYALTVGLFCLAAIVMIVMNRPAGLESRGFVSRSTHP